MQAEDRARSVVIVEDHPTVREGLALVLEQQGFPVVASVGTAGEGYAAVGAERPAVALIDIQLPDESGIELTRRLLRRDSGTRVLLYTAYDDPTLLEEGVDSGARGLVLKSAHPEETLRAVRAVAAGGSYVDAQLRAALSTQRAERAKVLSRREREVLSRVADGRSVEEIADDLVIAVDTVRTHIRNAMSKLEARTRAHAIVLALRSGEIRI